MLYRLFRSTPPRPSCQRTPTPPLGARRTGTRAPETREGRRIVLAAAACAFFSGSLLLAKPGVVKTLDGNTFQGEVTLKDGMAVIKDKRGIETRIKREAIATIEYVENIEIEYDRRHRDLSSRDVDGRVALARYCMAQKRPDLARMVLVEALTIDPNHRDAAGLYDVAKGQIALDRLTTNREAALPSPKAAGGAAVGGGEEKAKDGVGAPNEPVAQMPELLTPEQMNRIRQMELRQSDTSMSFKFENAVEKRYATKTMVPVGAINTLTPFERFIMLRERNEWGLLKDVKLQRDPQVIAEFRQTIHPRLLSGCTGAGCHGSGGGMLPLGDRPFQLRNQGEKEPLDYTNFYLLATGSYQPKEANGAFVPMIDRLAPERSLLLQYALPAPQATFPHPPVKGYRAIVHSVDDAKYQFMLRWIRDGLTPKMMDYGVVMGPPLGGAAVATPATAPSTRPGTTVATEMTHPEAQPGPHPGELTGELPGGKPSTTQPPTLVPSPTPSRSRSLNWRPPRQSGEKAALAAPAAGGR